MSEIFPLERAAEAYEHMMSGKARFRAFLTTKQSRIRAAYRASNTDDKSSKGTSLLAVAAIVLYAMTAIAQNATDICRPAPVILLASASEPPAKIVIDPPLAEPLPSLGASDQTFSR